MARMWGVKVWPMWFTILPRLRTTCGTCRVSVVSTVGTAGQLLKFMIIVGWLVCVVVTVCVTFVLTCVGEASPFSSLFCVAAVEGMIPWIMVGGNFLVQCVLWLLADSAMC